MEGGPLSFDDAEEWLKNHHSSASCAIIRAPVQLTPTSSPQRVLVVADKFKGTLTAEQAAAAIAEGWSSARGSDAIAQLPMADGGDGFGRILGRLLDARPRSCTSVDCAGRPCEASWWF